MDILQESIISKSDTILDFLLAYKEQHPDFTFSLRQRDFVNSDIKRLEAGQWFQGSDYIFVPLFKKGDSARKIKTLGFAIEFNKQGNITKSFVTISFKKGITNEKDISFHKKLAAKIGLKLNDNNYGSKMFDQPQEIITNLTYFVTEIRNNAIVLLDELGIKDEYIYDESEFQKQLAKINEIKTDSISKTKEVNYWVFQGSPKIYDTVSALNDNAVKTWTVSLKVSTIYVLVHWKRIPHNKIGKMLSFKKAEIDNWIKNCRVYTKVEINRLANEYLLKQQLNRY